MIEHRVGEIDEMDSFRVREMATYTTLLVLCLVLNRLSIASTLRVLILTQLLRKGVTLSMRIPFVSSGL